MSPPCGRGLCRVTRALRGPLCSHTLLQVGLGELRMWDREGLALLKPARVLPEPFPCGKTTTGRSKRSVIDNGGQGPSEAEAGMQEQYDPGDLPATQSTLLLLPFNETDGSPGEDSSSVIRIVGGQDCKDGECPWQVTMQRAWAAQAGAHPSGSEVDGAEM